MANAHSRRNVMTKVRVNGAILMEVDGIKDGVCNAFHALLFEMGDWRLSIRGFCFEVLGSDSSRSLDEPFSKEEVFNALSSLGGDRALDLDGFVMAFW